jgi:hypothetical protein
MHIFIITDLRKICSYLGKNKRLLIPIKYIFRRKNMELLLGLIVLGVAGYIAYQHFNKEKPNGSHPLDSVTKSPVVETVPVPEKVEETKVFVASTAHETVPVINTPKSSAPKKTKAAKKPAAAKPAGNAKPRAPKKPKMTVVK